MKMKHMLLFFISLLFLGTYLGKAQEEKEITAKDSIVKNNKYGLRLGLDLARPVRSLVDEDFSGYEIMADFRITDRFYIAAEFGNFLTNALPLINASFN